MKINRVHCGRTGVSHSQECRNLTEDVKRTASDLVARTSCGMMLIALSETVSLCATLVSITCSRGCNSYSEYSEKTIDNNEKRQKIDMEIN